MRQRQRCHRRARVVFGIIYRHLFKLQHLPLPLSFFHVADLTRRNREVFRVLENNRGQPYNAESEWVSFIPCGVWQRHGEEGGGWMMVVDAE